MGRMSQQIRDPSRFKRKINTYHFPEAGRSRPLRPRDPALANSSGAVMPSYPSPFEYLLAFGLVFAAGVLTSVGLRQYTDKIRREAAAAHA